MDFGVDFLDLGFSENELSKDTISTKKRFAEFISEARKQSKRDNCYHCGVSTTRFCNSHFVPAFCLRRIAVNGEVNYSNSLINLSLLDKDKGVNEAGTFRLICRECDSSIFGDYENPDNYSCVPTSRMLAQIAMKNYLKFISKRLLEDAMSSITANKFPHAIEVAHMQKNVQHLDLVEYHKGYEKAKRLSNKNWDGYYHLFYHQILDYVVPIAFQCAITLISDLEGKIINDIYNMSPDYHTKEVHICVFPLANTSVIMMFIDAEDKRYRNFYKQFNKLLDDDKLALTNYIIFLYSEDVFFSKALPQSILNNQNLIALSKKTTMAFAPNPFENPIEEVAQNFKLSHWDAVPNLLNKMYRLT